MGRVAYFRVGGCQVLNLVGDLCPFVLCTLCSAQNQKINNK